MTKPIDRVIPELQWAWPHWNVGNIEFFQRARKLKTAKLTPWDHGQEEAEHDEFRSIADPDRAGRWVPAGKYVSLAVWQKTQDEDVKMLQGEGPAWEMVMTDTPDEMNDHADVILNATGRVLIHGLGLGCVLNCLLHKPDVTHIDVVEANSDVIVLVYRYYQKVAREQRKTLNIYNRSCIDPIWPSGMRWNYVWHDIWTQISVGNLRQEDDPEHGISYELLHRKFGGRCDQQGAWAFERAQAMRRVQRYEDHVCRLYADAWNRSTPAERMDMIFEATIPMLSDMGKETWIKFLKMPENESGQKLLAQYERASRQNMTPFEAKMMLGDRLRRYAQQRTGFLKKIPNAA